MIYLIGGPPRSGKTTLAKKLAHRLRIGWVSADILESVVREYTPAKEYRRLFPKNILREQTQGSNDLMYTKFSAKQIVQAYIKQGKTTWKAIRVFIEQCVHESHDFIIEGHQLHPKLVSELMKKYPENIRAVFLTKQDEMSIVAGFTKNKATSDWVIQKTKNIAIFREIARMLIIFGTYIQEEANAYGLNVYSMDEKFSKQFAMLERVLLKTDK